MQRQRNSKLHRYVRESMWVVPALAVVLGAALAQVDLGFVERHISLPKNWQYSSETASVVLSAVFSAMAGLTGIVVAVTTLIIQMATGTLSPRYMRIWFRDPWQKAALAGFLGTMGFAFTLLRNTSEGSVPSLGVTITGVLALISVIILLGYIDRFAHLLRPVALSAYLAQSGAAVFRSWSRQVEAGWLTPVVAQERDRPADAADQQPPLMVRNDRNGVVQTIDGPGLLALARRHSCILALRCTVGDFVASGDALVEVLAAGTPPPADSVREMFAIGVERAFEQDPAFALRIIVDIAIRALSPAVNDPTTGVQLLDYIEGLLRMFGARELATRYELRDAAGDTRVVLPARSWDDYLALGIDEILEYGSTSVQVTRRLRALLEGLLESVHPANREAVAGGLERLDAALEEEVHDPVRRAYASKPDRQGIGGPAR